MVCLISDVVSDVITEISQVPGIATQVYASPRIRQYVQDAVLLEIEELWYPDYMEYFTVQPNGTTGQLSADMVGPISPITQFGDLAYVWPPNSNKPLNKLPPRMNPNMIVVNSASTGGGRLYISPDYSFPNRPFRVWPKTASDALTVWARQRPKLPVADSDKVYVDRLLLTYDAAWMYVTDDGTVPGQVDKFNKLAIKRRSQVHAGFATGSLPLDARQAQDATDQWWEA
jgi:hypothetical protein